MRAPWHAQLGACFVAAALVAACGGTAVDVGADGPVVTEVRIDATLDASGATFPKPFYEEAIAEYRKRQKGVTINYAGGGSGKGRTDLQTQQVDWAGSDGLVAEADKAKYKGGPFLYFPTVAAPITVSYNLSVDNVRLSPDTIAKIFSRQVVKWNDPAVVADNPGAKLPNLPIVVARRADGSGTTENFTKFLVAAAPGSWALKSGSTVEWPANTQAAQGNAGVTTLIKQTNGSIGYVDYSDAFASGLKRALVRNAAGNYVAPSPQAVSAALEGVIVNADLSYNPINAPGADSYPIAAPTWILVYRDQTDKAKAAALKAFLRYLLTDGQKVAPTVDFAPLPPSIAQQAITQIDQINVAG